VNSLLCVCEVFLRSRCAVPLFCVALAGCGRNEIKTYSVEKEASATPPMASSPAMPDSMPPGHPDIGGPALPQLIWTLPSGWEQQTPGQMRVASFSIKDANGKQADVSVVPLPGMAGGESANVNRWRGQVGLQPAPEDELKAQAQPVEVAGQPASLYDQAGKNPSSGDSTRILAVILHRDNIAWFFKMTGDDDLVARQKPAFVEFLKSLKFGAPMEATPMPASHPPMEGMALPPSHPPIGEAPLSLMSTAPASTGEGKPNWQVPAGWREVPGGQFLVAKFNLSGETGALAAVNVSASPGDGGGLAANVNRWRKQLGLGDLSGDEINKSVTSLEIAGGKATLVEMSGTDARTSQPAKLSSAIVTRSGQTWFYKLMGDAKVVDSQKDAFTKFVRGVKY
jgi:hypothetical protein